MDTEEILSGKEFRQTLYHKQTLDYLAMFTKKETAGKEHTAQELIEMIHKRQTRSRTVKKIIKDYGIYHPATLAARALAEGYQKLDEKYLRKFAEIIRKTFPKDPTTGYYSGESMPVTAGIAHLTAAYTPDIPVCFVEGDISNTGGVNEFFFRRQPDNKVTSGRKMTDKVIHNMCVLAKETIEKKAGKHVEVHALRSGGDEMRFMVYGLEKEELDELLTEKLVPQFNDMTIRLGLNNIPHTKMGRLPGLGLVFGTVKLNGNSPAQIHDEISEQIKHRKEVDELLRYGVVNEDGINNYMQYYKDYLSKQNSTRRIDQKAADTREKEVRDLLKETRQLWIQMTTKDGIFYGKIKNTEIEKPQDFFKRLALDSEKEIKKLANVKIKPHTTNSIVPFQNEKVLEKIEPPPITRFRKALKSFAKALPNKPGEKENVFDRLAREAEPLKWDYDLNRYALLENVFEKYFPGHKESNYDQIATEYDKKAHTILLLIIKMMDYLGSGNPVSRTRTTRFLLPYAERLVTQEPQKVKILKFTLTNLSGLNSINYELGNGVLRELGSILLQKTTEFLGEYNTRRFDIYDCGNGTFSILLDGSIMDKGDVEKKDIRALRTAIQDAVKQNIIDKKVVGFAEATFAQVRKDRTNSKESAEIIKRLKKDLKEKHHDADTVKISELPHPREENRRVNLIFDNIIEITKNNVADIMEIVTEPILEDISRGIKRIRG